MTNENDTVVFYLYPNRTDPFGAHANLELETFRIIATQVARQRHGFTYKDIRQGAPALLSKHGILTVLRALEWARWLEGSEEQGWKPLDRDFPTTFEFAASPDDFSAWIASRRATDNEREVA